MPTTSREQYGADACRLYICFLGPLEKDKPWTTKGIEGVRRFLDRLYRLVVDDKGQHAAVETRNPGRNLISLTHKTIKKVGDDVESR